MNISQCSLHLRLRHCLLCLLYFTCVAIPAPIRFLGRDQDAHVWADLQENFTETMENGTWVDVTYTPTTPTTPTTLRTSTPTTPIHSPMRPMYVKPCRQEGEFFDSFTTGEHTHGACFHSLANQGMRYEWTPRAAPLHAWSPATMCEMLEGRNVLLAGDSLTGELFFSFASAMLFQAEEGEKGEAEGAQGAEAGGAEAGVGGGGGGASIRLDQYRLQMLYCNNDWFCPYNQPCRGPVEMRCPQKKSTHLDDTGADTGAGADAHTDAHTDAQRLSYLSYESISQLSPSAQNALSSRIISEKISLLVLNVGAHYDPALPNQLRATLTHLYKTHPDLSIIWRNTPTGHFYCKQAFSSPPPGMLKNADYERLNYTTALLDQETVATSDKHQWRSIGQQNGEVRRILEQEFPQVFWLDVAESTAFRYSMPYALCPMPYALCPMPYALCLNLSNL
jgi:hypothetical protein